MSYVGWDLFEAGEGEELVLDGRFTASDLEEIAAMMRRGGPDESEATNDQRPAWQATSDGSGAKSFYAPYQWKIDGWQSIVWPWQA